MSINKNVAFHERLVASEKMQRVTKISELLAKTYGLDAQQTADLAVRVKFISLI